MQAVALIAALSLGFLLLADLGSTRQSTRAPCSAEVASRTECGHSGIIQSQCLKKGCCWSPANKSGVPSCFFAGVQSPTAEAAGQCKASGPRFECGKSVRLELDCTRILGCCWDNDGMPSCFYPTQIYKVSKVTPEKLGVEMTLTAEGDAPKKLPFTNISPLTFSLVQETNDRLHVRIYEPGDKRWKVPESILRTPPAPSSLPGTRKYSFEVPKEGEEFYFAVLRKSDNQTIFNTSSYGVLQFSDQYISVGTALPDGYNIYGFGERKGRLRITPSTSCENKITLWNSDAPGIPENNNLYGSHPFYLEVDGKSGSAHGVFLKNSNGMDVVATSSALHYHIIGGVIDFYFFLGPQPEAVISQYLEVIGRPTMPPYWALGFHQSRYGYKTLDDVKDVVDKYKKNRIPLDTIWNDIDYMDQYRDFTLDPKRYPPAEVKQFVDDLHAQGMHYVAILDPGIAVNTSYEPFNYGKSKNVFIKDANGKNALGKVWPGSVYFLDFHNPNTTEFWQKEISNFTKLADVDGLWIDMNECSNFCSGTCSNSSGSRSANQKTSSKFDAANPPYDINNSCKKMKLSTKTLAMNDTYYNGTMIEYNAHNLYGMSEAIATHSALKSLRPGKRPFVLCRSTFPGTGAYASHWNGDNSATVEDLAYSIPMMLSFQMFGMPMVGSDICGFLENTTEELCARWMQVGAFYPFARNHNNKDAISQEPYLWKSVANVSRQALLYRYSFLPYYYTLFHKANQPLNDSVPPAATVTRPLFFEFPKDPKTYSIDAQFMVGPAVLISPVLKTGNDGKSVQAYFPPSLWYDRDTHNLTSHGNETLTIPTPLDVIPIHIRGGYVVPGQDTGLTTRESRRENFFLLVALDSKGEAQGDLYIDDGESIDNSKMFLYVKFTVANNELKGNSTGSYSEKTISRQAVAIATAIDRIRVMSVAAKPKSVTANGKNVTSTYDSTSHSLLVGPALDIPLNESFSIKW